MLKNILGMNILPKKIFPAALSSPSDSRCIISRLWSPLYYYALKIVLSPHTLSFKKFFFPLDAWLLPSLPAISATLLHFLSHTSLQMPHPLGVSWGQHQQEPGDGDDHTGWDCGLVCTVPQPPINSRSVLWFNQHRKKPVKRVCHLERITRDLVGPLSSQRAGLREGVPIYVSQVGSMGAAPSLEQLSCPPLFLPISSHWFRESMETQILFYWTLTISIQWCSSPVSRP